MTSYSQFSINLGFVKVKKGDFMIECIRTIASAKHIKPVKVTACEHGISAKRVVIRTVKSK